MGKSKKRSNISKEGVRDKQKLDDWVDEKEAILHDDEIGLDDVDQFHEERDKIYLDSDIENTDGLGSDGEEFDNSDLASENEFDDEEESDEDYLNDPEIMREVMQKVPALRKHVKIADEDENPSKSEGEDIEEDVDLMAWGKRKSMYYDDEAEDDEDLIEEEQEEAARLQKEKMNDMSEQDFMLEDDSFESLIKKGQKMSNSVQQDLVSDNLKNELDKIHINFDEPDIEDAENIAQDFSKLSRDELIQRISVESPELLDLVQEFKAKSEELKTKIAPVLKRLKDNENPTDKGISLLELKNQLLLNYLLNISFYLYLRVSGKSVRDHPVIEKLVELRLYIEKLKPLEQKLKYQIDKLVKASVSTNSSEQYDSLNFKPRLDDMVPEESRINEEQDNSGVYKPPRIAPVPYEDESEKGKNRRQNAEKLKQKALKSNMMKDLMNEFTETPEEIADAGNMLQAAKNKDQEWEDRIRAEEEMMTRLPVTRKDKKKIKEQKKFSNELEDLGDFGEYNVIQQLAPDAAEQSVRKTSLRSIIESQVKDTTPRDNSTGGDVDVPRREKRRNLDTLGEDYNTHLDETQAQSDSYSEDEYYTEVKNQKTKAQKDKQNEFSMQFEPMYDEEEEEIMGEGKRQITHQIMKNKGLTPKRPKEQRNPRVKRRKKYEKSLKKLKSFKPMMKNQDKAYGGEETGIKKNLSRSVKFSS